MKTLVLYYSYTGHTKKIAEELAALDSADTVEIKEAKRPSVLKAYTAGCIAAMRSKSWPIQPLDVDYTKYERLIMLAPIWANNPPPAFYAAMEQLPGGKAVILKMVAASGKSNCKEKLEAVIKAKGSSMENFEVIKA